MTDKRSTDETRADVIVSHFLGTKTVPTIPDALRLSEQIARALAAVRRIGPGSVVTLAGPETTYVVGSLETSGADAVLRLRTEDGRDWTANR